jgi:hypothetical protein
MRSIKKLIANWINGSKGKGPVTPEGKKTSSRNSTTHGLFAKEIPVPKEDQEMCRRFCAAIFEEFQPQGPTEHDLTIHYIDQCMRLRGCFTLETDLLEWYRTYSGIKGDLGVAFAHDASQFNCLSRLSKYAGIFERGMRKTLVDLKQLQATRSKRVVGCEPSDESKKSTPNAGEQPGEGWSTSVPTLADNPTDAEHGAPSAPYFLISNDFLERSARLDEDRFDLRAYVQSLFEEWRPKSASKTIFLELYGVTFLRLARASRTATELFEQYRVHQGVLGDSLTAFVQDSAELDCFTKLGAYESRLRNSLSKTLKSLQG